MVEIEGEFAVSSTCKADDCSIALALWLAERLVVYERAQTIPIINEIERLYAAADSEDMQWLLAVLAGVQKICGKRDDGLDT